MTSGVSALEDGFPELVDRLASAGFEDVPEEAIVVGDCGAVSTGRSDMPLPNPRSELYFPVSPDWACRLPVNASGGR